MKKQLDKGIIYYNFELKITKSYNGKSKKILNTKGYVSTGTNGIDYWGLAYVNELFKRMKFDSYISIIKAKR